VSEINTTALENCKKIVSGHFMDRKIPGHDDTLSIACKVIIKQNVQSCKFAEAGKWHGEN
jgi:hypothetical protein